MTRDVLLVEDEPLYRASIAGHFPEGEYRFLEAESPAEAIEVLRENPRLQVVLLDLSFAVGKATDVLDFLAARGTSSRVIVLTAHERLLRAEKAGEYKVFHYLPKAETSSSEAIRFSVDLAFRDLEREHLSRKTQLLLEVQRCINDNEPLSQTLDRICQAIREIVGAYTCHIRVYDFKKGDFHLEGFAGGNPEIRELFALPRAKGDLFSGAVVETGEAKVYPDLQKDPDFQEFARRAIESTNPTPAAIAYWRTVRSAYIVPLFTRLYYGKVDAVVNASSDKLDDFDAENRAFIDEFAIQAALAVTKDWLRRKREEAYEDYGEIAGMLSEMSQKLDGGSDLAPLFDVVLQRISDLVHPELVSIFLFNEATKKLENVAELRGGVPNPAPRECYEPGRSLTGTVFETDATIQLPSPDPREKAVSPLNDDRFDHENLQGYLQQLPSGEILHYLGVPIRIGGRPRGVLRAVNKKSAYYDPATAKTTPLCLLERGFSFDCRHVLEITASHLGVAIRNAELLREKETQVNQLRTLGEVGNLVNKALDIKDVLRLTMQEIARVMQSEICMLFLKDGEDRIVLEESYGMPRIEGAFYDLGEGVTGAVAQKGEPRLLVEPRGGADGKYDREILAFLGSKHGEPKAIESLMVVPINAKSTVLGVLKVINKVGGSRRYGEEDLAFFKTFADTVGVALENAQAYTNLSLLVSAVAHEINNTLGVISPNLEGVRLRLGHPGPEIERMLFRIDDLTLQATEFANEITGFSASRVGEQGPLDLNAIVRSTIDDVDITKYGVASSFQLELNLTSEPLVCEVYARSFSQIVRNITINALQALEGRKDGRLSITSARSPGFAVLLFRDNGPGIKSADKARIFEAEFTTKHRGNGIGLWLVRIQLQRIGGTIRVLSEPGSGAMFIVRVPLFQPAPEAM
jgi:signal transduction histidine kinase/CheY-like chemotaxis protein